MLSRRNLRVKVMQAVYAYQMESYGKFELAEKALLKNVEQPAKAYMYILFLLQHIAYYAIKDAEHRAARHLQTADDINLSSRIAETAFVSSLESDEAFQAEIKFNKFDKFDFKDLVKSLFEKMKAMDEYRLYAAKEKPTDEDGLKVLKAFFKKVMSKSELYESHMEENFSHWQDDKSMVAYGVMSSIDDFQKKKRAFEPACLDLEETKKFAKSLLSKTIEYDDEFKQLIEPKLLKWDVERMAVLDVILLKLALCEFIDFPEIPVKVTINEYIEISKVYSTPKSKEFVNGVLDKLSKELKESGKIKKTGRGLME